MTVEDLEAQVKKLSMRATEAKLALHDLSEDLPIDWEKIPAMAERTWMAFRDLDDARKAVKAAKLVAKDI